MNETTPHESSDVPVAGRQAYLDRKRNATRDAILAAAKKIFAGSTYVQAKIADIIRTAKVSRATFYAHFGSKLELAYAIYDEIGPQTDALFAQLPQAGAQGLPAVMDWLSALVALNVEHRYVTPLIAQLQLFERSFRLRVLEDQEAIIGQLRAAGIRSVMIAEGTGAEALRQRAAARLMLSRTVTICAEAARGEMRPFEAEASLELVGEELLRFLRD